MLGVQCDWSVKQAECLIDLGRCQAKRTCIGKRLKAFSDAHSLLDGAEQQGMCADAAAGAAFAYMGARDVSQAQRYMSKALEWRKRLMSTCVLLIIAILIVRS